MIGTGESSVGSGALYGRSKGPEGRTTRAIERRTSQLPSGAYLGLAIGAMAISGGLVLAGSKQLGNFVGQWAPTILIMGLYNKIVKELHPA